MRTVVALVLLLVAFAADWDPVLAAPEATSLFPGGGQPGQTVTVNIGGALPNWPVGFWTNNNDVKFTAREEQGKASAEIPQGVATGVIWVRVYDSEGAAQPRPWMIGAAAEFNEEEPNDQAINAQLAPCSDAPRQTIVINGRLQQAGDADVFAVNVSQGQTLVADLDANESIASAFDGVLQVLRPDGTVAAHNDDSNGLDPRLAVEADQSGRWMVRLFGFPATPTEQVRLAGDVAYVYRLTLSTGPVIHYTLPLAARRGHCNRFEVHGWNLPDELRSISLQPTSKHGEFHLAEHLFGRTIRLPLLEYPATVESEPNNQSEPTLLELPASVTCRLNKPGDRDAFQIESVNDQTIEIELQSRDLGFPLDGVLELIDAKDQRIARVDDSGASRDPRIVHRANKNGPFRVVVSDLHGRGGHEYVYRLAVARLEASFRLTTGSHQAIVKAGEKAEIVVNVERTLEFDEEVEFQVDGLPQSVVASAPVSISGDDSAVKIVVTLSAAADAAQTSTPFRITGRSKSGHSQTVRFAAPGRNTGLADVWLTVTK